MISGEAKLAGVMGFPIKHSLSPRLHQHWLARYEIDGAYIPFRVEPSELADSFKLLPRLGLRGWNLTVPHKEAALGLVDEVDDTAQAIGAVNTVIVREDNSLFGTNTDSYGFITNLQQQVGDLTPYLQRAVVLGAGGAARAIVHGLIQAGAKEIIVTNRTQKRADDIVAAFGGKVTSGAWEQRDRLLEGASLLVNTTVLGMNNQLPLSLSLAALPNTSLVTDIVYAPLLTPLLQKAAEKGCKTVTGIGMLIHQAVPGFQVWFGKEPEVTGEEEALLLA